MWIYIIGFVILFLIWFNKPKEESGIVLYFANVGTGKTTFLAKKALEERKRINKGKSKYTDIVSNAEIKGTIYIPDLRKVLRTGAFKNALFLIDEASIEYNNRKQNLTEVELQIFKLIRHYHCTAIVVSQSYNDIDVTLRRLYSQIFLLNWLPVVTLIRPIKKYVGIDDMTNDIVDKYKFKFFFSWRTFVRPKYFKYFDSWWIPSHIPIHDPTTFMYIDEIEKRPMFNWLKNKDIKTIISDDEVTRTRNFYGVKNDIIEKFNQYNKNDIPLETDFYEENIEILTAEQCLERERQLKES